MASLREQDVMGTGRRRLMSPGAVCLVVGLAMLVTLPGCGGCRKDPAEAKKELEKKLAEERAKKKEEEKPNFEVSPLVARPTSGLKAGRPEAPGALYKPGHWTAAALEAKANHFNFVGDLEMVIADGRQRPIPLLGSPFDLTTSCPVYLAEKKPPKPVESLLFVPPTDRYPVGSWRLNYRKGGSRAWEGSSALRRMPSYQYHLVVLARWPENYAYLKGLASVKPPSDSYGTSPAKPYYEVALIRADKPDPPRRLPLPSYGLWWTSIACVLWDDAEPNALDLLQQEALLDWLHWGGQLILSGPNTLDKLSSSFLAPYLPATAAPGVRKLSKEDFEELHQWSGKSIRPLVPGARWTGVELKIGKDRQANFMPGSGDLLVEGRVGGGRIVVSAFGLGGRTLRSWPGTDELLNAFLFRRPPRKFRKFTEEEFDKWGEWEVTWADPRLHRFDAGLISNLRYFTRDTGVRFADYGADVRSDSESTSWFDPVLPAPAELPSPGPGVAAWNDFNPVANSARATLKDAAEIEIPDRSFVVWVVAAYLLVLVPANWTVFRLINRVEWAWAAAPAIAVACTVVVIRLAQLDIGFARSLTEVAVVELQGDYPRAHVTRYSALYTSLTTSYDFHLNRPDPSDWTGEPEDGDPGGLALPFPEVDDPRRFQTWDRRTLLFSRGRDASLTGYSVQSNLTGMVHSEQMIDLGGGLSFVKTSPTAFQVINQTGLTFSNAAVVRKSGFGGLEVLETAWLGTLQPGAKAQGRFKRQPRASPRRATNPQPGDLDLRSLAQKAEDPRQLDPGEVRLIAELRDGIPGLAVRPVAPQAKYATLVVAHLEYDVGEDPQPDLNVLETGLGADPATDTGPKKTSQQGG